MILGYTNEILFNLINECTPSSHIKNHIPRDNCRGGVVTTIFNSFLLKHLIPKLNHKSNEKLILSISDSTTAANSVVHRAPGPYNELLSEFCFFQPLSLE